MRSRGALVVLVAPRCRWCDPPASLPRHSARIPSKWHLLATFGPNTGCCAAAPPSPTFSTNPAHETPLRHIHHESGRRARGAASTFGTNVENEAPPSSIQHESREVTAARSATQRRAWPTFGTNVEKEAPPSSIQHECGRSAARRRHPGHAERRRPEGRRRSEARVDEPYSPWATGGSGCCTTPSFTGTTSSEPAARSSSRRVRRARCWSGSGSGTAASRRCVYASFG